MMRWMPISRYGTSPMPINDLPVTVIRASGVEHQAIRRGGLWFDVDCPAQTLDTTLDRVMFWREK